jgi:small subunit ribosomal protein S4
LSRYTEARCKLCRNEGKKLFLKSEEKCNSAKCPFERRSYPSGQHGQARKKRSEYGGQLREKQAARYTYSVSEKQFRNNFAYAVSKKGVTGTIMLQRLEMRFDNVLHRSLIPSRVQARLLITHGHFLVDGHKVDIPSYIMKPGQVITVSERSKSFISNLAQLKQVAVPYWMEADAAELKVKVVSTPAREDIASEINEPLIIEYYKR